MKDKDSLSQSAEDIYKRVFKSFPVCVYIWKKVEDDLILIDFSYELEKTCSINLEKHKGDKASELYVNEPEILSDLKRCIEEKSIISKEMVYKFKLMKREKFVNVIYRFIPKDLVLVYIEDISDQKEIEESLKKEEKEKSIVLEAISEHIIYYNNDFNIISANKAAADSLNLNPEQLIGRKCYELWHKRNEPCEDCPVLKAFKMGKLMTSEIITPDGRIWLIKGHPVYDDKGEIIGVVEITREITQLKQAEIKIKESEEKYRNLINNVMDEIVETDLDGTITYVNPQVFDIFGFKPEEIIGKKSIDFVHPEDISIIKESMRKAIDSGEIISSEYRIKHKDGNYVPISSRGNLIKKKDKVKLVAVIRDISEQKLAEKRLKDSEQQYRIILDSMGDVIHVVDRSLRILFTNPTYKKWVLDLGFEVDVIEKKLNEVFPWLPKKVFDEYDQIFEKGEALVSDEITKINGQIFYTESRKIPIFREDKVDQIITVIRDISKRKIAEQKLKESEEKYRKAYNRADFYKDLFAHDMNNILQNIYSATQLNLMDLNKNKDIVKLKENLEITLDQVNRGARLISNVRKLTKLEDSGSKLEAIDALSVLKKSIDFIKNAYQNRDIDIKINCEIEKPVLNANNLLEDVFENILINAIKYNENTPIKILIEISEDLKDNESYIKFEFRDNGIGIEDSRKNSIFLRNHQTEVSHRGMGLGLSLVRKIISNYRGNICVEDNVSGDYTKGSNFVILIPEVN